MLDLITSKQALPIASRDLAKVFDPSRQFLGLLLTLSHPLKELLILLFEANPIGLLFIAQDMSRLMKPLIGLFNSRPERLSVLQATINEPLQLRKLLREPLFSSMRPIEVEMSCSRSRKRSPAGSRGACPSSVRALLTAKA
jgi:hypothetical protein